MTYKEAKAEIDAMLAMLPGAWSVEEIRIDRDDGDLWYCGAWSLTDNVLLVSGRGRTKAAALEDLLENWRKGRAWRRAPAAGSAAELALKLAAEGN